MRSLSCAVAALVVCAASPFARPQESASLDQAKLQGRWAAVAIERDGTSLPGDDVAKLDLLLTIQGDAFEWKPLASKGPEHFPFGRIRIDASAKPKGIDFVIEPYFPGMKQSTALGIYAFEGERLKLLKGAPAQDRPRAFATTGKAGWEMIVFRRVAAR